MKTALGARNTQEWKTWHQIAAMENAGVDKAVMCDTVITDFARIPNCGGVTVKRSTVTT